MCALKVVCITERALALELDGGLKFRLCHCDLISSVILGKLHNYSEPQILFM